MSVSMLLQAIVEETAPSEIVVHSSLTGAVKIANHHFDLALLDIELTDGKTYEIAKSLRDTGTPFVFVSGFPQHELPEEFRGSSLIAKPFRPDQIRKVVFDAKRQKSSRDW